MPQSDLSRRRFALITGTAALTQLPATAATNPSASEIVTRIKTALGGDWPTNGLDGFKIGKPDTPVTGIATTAMATMDVLKKAVQSRLNLIITHEPTFFSRQDSPLPQPIGGGRGRGATPPPSAPEDPVYKAKNEFIEKSGLVIFRLNDHWRTRKENDLTTALAAALGWKNKTTGEQMFYDIPAATLEDTVALIRKKLAIRGGLRSVGDPKSKVRRVMLHPGLMTPAIMWANFGKTDLLIAGEVREWECVHYAADINSAGEKRSLVSIGKVVSEEPGMKACADWLKTIAKGIPVKWISAGDPYWRPL